MKNHRRVQLFVRERDRFLHLIVSAKIGLELLLAKTLTDSTAELGDELEGVLDDLQAAKLALPGRKR